MRKSLISMAVAGGFAFAAFGAVPAYAADIVGLITKTENNPFFVKMREGAETKAKELGIELRSFAGKYDGDNDSQVAAIENLISAGAKGFAIVPSDSKAIVPTIQKAKDAGLMVIVLDTPPTANALDFLDAPERLSAAIDSPAIEWLSKPYREAGHFTLKALGMGASFVLSRLSRFVGSAFLEEMARFLVEFNQVLGGFRERAQKIYDALRRPDVAFVLVSSAEPMSIDEALYFYDRLRTGKLPFGGFVVNRVHPRRPELGVIDRGALLDKLERRPELNGFQPDDLVQLAADLQRTHAELDALAQVDREQIDRLRKRTTAPIVEVPLFEEDVYDLPALTRLLGYLAA